MSDEPRIIVALDYDDPERAVTVARSLDPALCRLKVGLELFVRAGPDIVERLHAAGFDVFLDLKFHDIPNTVAAACRVAAGLGVWMVNVHAQGGTRMLAAAREAIGTSAERPRLVAVTLLTSMDSDDLRALGCTQSPSERVGHLARISADAGCDGVVCSAQEAASLKVAHGPEFLLVTPGIRPVQTDDDQRRAMTPRAALSAGADFLVIGRPITASPVPRDALASIAADL